MNKICGIYSITHVSGKRYIGSSVNVGKRFSQHRDGLRKDRHGNVHLRSAWRRDGEGAFSFELLEECEVEQLIEREQFWIDHHQSTQSAKGYNKTGAVASRRGVKASPETCARIGASKLGNQNRKGKTHTRATKDAISAKLTGTKASEETKEKLSAFQKVRPRSAESSARIGAAHRGKTISDEQKAYLSSLYKGRTKAGGRWV